MQNKRKYLKTHTKSKAVDDEGQQVVNAFHTLVSNADRCGNLRKFLKQNILQSVNILGKIFAEMKTQLENKSKETKKLN